MYCYNCDTHNPEAANFCVICGKPLSNSVAPMRANAPAGAATASYAPPQPTAFAPTLAPAGANVSVVQNVYMNPAQPQIFAAQGGVSLLVRAIWFLAVGLWLGQVWLMIAWLFNLTVIGLPLGIWMLNRLPQVMTLRAQTAQLSAPQVGGMFAAPRPDAAPFAVRVIYFVLIGWWVSLLWLQIAWALAASLIGLPLAFLMFERTETVTTLGN